jgi:hypothetical protein
MSGKMMILKQKEKKGRNVELNVAERTPRGCVEQRKKAESVIISFEWIQGMTRLKPR